MKNSKVIKFRASSTKTTSTDLIWDLDSINSPYLASEFLRELENNISIYSKFVKQIYTNFKIIMPNDKNNKLAVLPNLQGYQDTFSNIPEKAVKATGYQIVPGHGGLSLIIPFKKGKKKYRAVPLQIGLNIINNRRPPNKPIIPIIMKGDLREHDSYLPAIHLHEIVEEELQHLSQQEVKNIHRVIKERLEALTSTTFDFEQKKTCEYMHQIGKKARCMALSG